MLRCNLSVLSEAAHYLIFSCRRPPRNGDKGQVVFSVDVDVGSQMVGIRNGGLNDRNVNDSLPERVVGRIEEQAVPLLVRFFNDAGVPATFAVRGQLTEVASPVIGMILSSPIEHEIGAHGYYHKTFTTLSSAEAEQELEMTSEGMRKFGIEPRSFVFPRNKIAHLPLLEKWKYLCFRGFGNLVTDGMYVKRCGGLYDIRPGLYLGRCNDSIFPERILDVAVRYRAPLHVWFHPWDLGDSVESINRRIARVLGPFVRYAREKQDKGELRFETMRSLASNNHA